MMSAPKKLWKIYFPRCSIMEKIKKVFQWLRSAAGGWRGRGSRCGGPTSSCCCSRSPCPRAAARTASSPPAAPRAPRRRDGAPGGGARAGAAAPCDPSRGALGEQALLRWIGRPGAGGGGTSSPVRSRRRGGAGGPGRRRGPYIIYINI
jgi:hypothetical protein